MLQPTIQILHLHRNYTLTKMFFEEKYFWVSQYFLLIIYWFLLYLKSHRDWKTLMRTFLEWRNFNAKAASCHRHSRQRPVAQVYFLQFEFYTYCLWEFFFSWFFNTFWEVHTMYKLMTCDAFNFLPWILDITTAID